MSLRSRKLPLRCSDAHLSVEAVFLLVLCRGAAPVAEDVAPEVSWVPFPLPGRAKQSGPVGFEEGGDNPATATNELVARDLFDLEAFGP